MYKIVLPVLLLLASLADAGATAAGGSELVLAGGSLALCSSLSVGACRDGEAPSGRGASVYLIDDEGIARLSALAFAKAPAGTASMVDALRELAASGPGGPLSAQAIEDALARQCEGDACAWARLDDNQRAGVLAALEQPQQDAQGRRLEERVSLLASREQGGAAVIQRFVAAARQRAGERTPRIAFVTASGFDPFDAVDYYTSLFTEAGAEAVWWPLEPASAALVAADGDCDRLTALQAAELGLPDRSPVFPDLVAQQRAWCASAQRAALPADIHGLFFAGGDQWRLRGAFFAADDRPYPWLLSLRQALADGRLVVGGTSAGTAVQSGPGMLSNGSPQRALLDGPRKAIPPTPGCTRAERCSGLAEDAFTTWTAGGLGLSGPFLMDTHFSERAREWRLLRALAEGPARAGLGIDETSAIHLRRRGAGWELEALGARGGWLFEAGERGCGSLHGRAHYLAPGRTLNWPLAGAGSEAPALDQPQREGEAMPALDLAPVAEPGNPFARGAVRAGIAPLALGLAEWSIEAPGARLELRRSARSESWTGSGALPGLTAIEFSFTFSEGCAAAPGPR